MDLGRWRRAAKARARLSIGIAPLSERWGADRGQPIHRHYLERFLARHAADVCGRVLEFNDPLYTRQYGQDRVADSQVLHLDQSNPRATIVADLTRPNEVPSDHFDCVICTHVLHIVFDLPAMVRSLHRILRPGGVLLAAVPQLSMAGPEYHELWRFTAEGLSRLLAGSFDPARIEATTFGNSLAAAAEIRGLVAEELTRAELEAEDPRFGIEVCARAVK
jgi:SAM-dependent methyltransferase